MATRLLLMADTHVPKRARELPAELWQGVEEADLVVHAGDWVDVRLLDELEERSRRPGTATGRCCGLAYEPASN